MSTAKNPHKFPNLIGGNYMCFFTLQSNQLIILHLLLTVTVVAMLFAVLSVVFFTKESHFCEAIFTHLI